MALFHEEILVLEDQIQQRWIIPYRPPAILYSELMRHLIINLMDVIGAFPLGYRYFGSLWEENFGYDLFSHRIDKYVIYINSMTCPLYGYNIKGGWTLPINQYRVIGNGYSGGTQYGYVIVLCELNISLVRLMVDIILIRIVWWLQSNIIIV